MRQRPWSAGAAVDLGPASVDLVAPEALKPRDDGEPVCRTDRGAETGHDAAERPAATRDRLLEHRQRVMPGVRRAVQRRRWIMAIRPRGPPVGGRAAIGRVASRAIGLVERFAGLDLRRRVPAAG